MPADGAARLPIAVPGPVHDRVGDAFALLPPGAEAHDEGVDELLARKCCRRADLQFQDLPEPETFDGALQGGRYYNARNAVLWHDRKEKGALRECKLKNPTGIRRRVNSHRSHLTGVSTE